jgi:Family of unknown function (DUF6150)
MNLDRRKMQALKTPVVLGILGMLLMHGKPSVAQQFNAPYYCELRGSVYIEEYPEQADLMVYEEDSEAFANLLVFETDNALFADRAGIWFFTTDRAFADFTVYFVESRDNADFSVYFTSFESFAGCNN